MSAPSNWPRNRLLLALPSSNLKQLMPELEHIRCQREQMSKESRRRCPASQIQAGRLMTACAEICRTAAHFMLMNSEHAKHLCKECAEIFDQCEADCERLGDM
jgi:hypothetical protein